MVRVLTSMFNMPPLRRCPNCDSMQLREITPTPSSETTYKCRCCGTACDDTTTRRSLT